MHAAIEGDILIALLCRLDLTTLNCQIYVWESESSSKATDSLVLACRLTLLFNCVKEVCGFCFCGGGVAVTVKQK